MAQEVKVVVRPLLGDKALEGAYRIHLTPETLESARLKLGDLCEIKSDDGVTLGIGIAWRAADKMGSGNSSIKHVRMTEMLRNALNLNDGAHISLSKTGTKLSSAIKVVLRDCTPPDYAQEPDVKAGKGVWKWRAAFVLSTCEAFSNGVTFDVAGARKPVKKRFRVVDVQASTFGPGLHHCDDDTEVILENPTAELPEASADTPAPEKLLSSEFIGGLSDQLQELNESMKRVLHQYKDPRTHSAGEQINEGIIIHGYEGTGKSHLVKQLRSMPFRIVLQISPYSQTLASGSLRLHDSIRNTFKEAEANQPSMILIDDCHIIAPSSEHGVSGLIANELDRLAGQKVLVIATCRNLADVNNVLLDPGRLAEHIELLAPDSVARASILRIILPKGTQDQSLADEIASKTHGFTGKDLKKLVMAAYRNACRRNQNQQGSSESLSSRTHGRRNDEAHADTNSQELSTAATQEDTKEPPTSSLYNLDDFDHALTKVRPTALREIIFEQPKIGWQDIGGSGAIKERFDEALGWPLYHADQMAKWRKQPQRGILLYGPPGCSKTLTAQAVASQYRQNFLPVKGAELISMYVGESERAIRDIFRKARQAAPCVVFFDEIDSIASERETGSSKGLNIVTTLLNEMDGFETLNGVLVLAATNKPEALDPAIMRPGRFGSHIHLGLPIAAARKEILQMRLAGLPVDGGIDMDTLVTDTEGYSGAEITHICELATTAGLRREITGSGSLLYMDDLKAAIAQTKKSITPEMLASYDAFAAI